MLLYHVESTETFINLLLWGGKLWASEVEPYRDSHEGRKKGLVAIYVILYILKPFTKSVLIKSHKLQCSVKIPDFE